VPALSVSRYFWIMAKTSAGPFSVRIVLSLLVRRSAGTPLAESLPSQIAASQVDPIVTMTTLNARTPGLNASPRPGNTIVSDLLSPGCARSDHRGGRSHISARVCQSGADAAPGDRAVLLIASDDLDAPTVRFGDKVKCLTMSSRFDGPACLRRAAPAGS